MHWHFNHLAFNSANGAHLQEAFSALLDLQPGSRPPFPFPGRWLYQGSQALVHIIERDAFIHDHLSHLALHTDSPAEQVLQRVEQSGLPFHLTQVPGDSLWQCFVQLPGGLLLELNARKTSQALVS